MGTPFPGGEKIASLLQHYALNPTPEAVVDAAFQSGNPFFDARDLVQVKYEMLRRVGLDGMLVSHAARLFGFSRPSFYLARRHYDEGGLSALVSQRPGPRRAHKLSEPVVAFLEQALGADPSLRAAQLQRLLATQWGLDVHPRSVERALGRARKRGRYTAS